MAEFIKGNRLNSELESIFELAEDFLVLISPFIKLHPRFKDALKLKKENHKMEIIIVFGKNEENMSKSFSFQEFEFLKDFPNIQIKYEPRLHAKYYANEKAAIITSMNLYDFSQNNNIEVGILTKNTGIVSLTQGLTGNGIDQHAFNYFYEVTKNSELVFKRSPNYESKFKGIIKKYEGSVTEVDSLSGLLTNKDKKVIRPKERIVQNNFEPGYCIRTGDKIPYNPAKPFCAEAYKEWNLYKNKDYKEKFCHYSGEPSKGNTSFTNPILVKNIRFTLQKDDLPY